MEEFPWWFSEPNDTSDDPSCGSRVWARYHELLIRARYFRQQPVEAELCTSIVVDWVTTLIMTHPIFFLASICGRDWACTVQKTVSGWGTPVTIMNFGWLSWRNAVAYMCIPSLNQQTCATIFLYFPSTWRRLNILRSFAAWSSHMAHNNLNLMISLLFDVVEVIYGMYIHT